jgi:type IX secretion system PorP/SprF family membrane protein
MTALNPYKDISAYGGIDRTTSIFGHIRSQWNQLGGQPRHQYLSVHTPVYLWNGGVGLDFLNQRSGDTRTQSMRFSYNYVQGFYDGLISFGGRVGIIQASLNGHNILTPGGDYNDGLINHNDPVLSSNLQNGLTPIWEFSALFTNANLVSGISFLNFPSLKIKAGDSRIGLNPQINFYLGYYSNISDKLDFQVSTTLRTDLINYQAEINSLFKINGNVFGGIGLRGYNTSTLDALGIMVGHNLNDQFSLFYSYDIGLSKLNSVHQGSHELLIKYRLRKLFGTGLPPEIIYNPRFL